MNTIRAFVLLMISAAALPAAAPIEDMKDAKTVLSEVAKAMGAEGLKTLHYSGTGSSYIVTPGPVSSTPSWSESIALFDSLSTEYRLNIAEADIRMRTSRLAAVRVCDHRCIDISEAGQFRPFISDIAMSLSASRGSSRCMPKLN